MELCFIMRFYSYGLVFMVPLYYTHYRQLP